MLLEKRPAYLRFLTFRAFAGNEDKVNVVLFVIWNSNAFICIHLSQVCLHLLLLHILLYVYF